MSEFYKIKADFLLYGFANKKEIDFAELVIVNLNKLQDIIIAKENIGYRSYLDEDGHIIAPVLANANGDSEFIAIGIDLLEENYPKLIRKWK